MVVCLGRLVPPQGAGHAGPGLAGGAATRHPGARLLLVGDGPDRGRLRTRWSDRGRGAGRPSTFTGGVAWEDVPAYIDAGGRVRDAVPDPAPRPGGRGLGDRVPRGPGVRSAGGDRRVGRGSGDALSGRGGSSRGRRSATAAAALPGVEPGTAARRLPDGCRTWRTVSPADLSRHPRRQPAGGGSRARVTDGCRRCRRTTAGDASPPKRANTTPTITDSDEPRRGGRTRPRWRLRSSRRNGSDLRRTRRATVNRIMTASAGSGMGAVTRGGGGGPRPITAAGRAGVRRRPPLSAPPSVATATMMTMAMQRRQGGRTRRRRRRARPSVMAWRAGARRYSTQSVSGCLPR